MYPQPIPQAPPWSFGYRSRHNHDSIPDVCLQMRRLLLIQGTVGDSWNALLKEALVDIASLDVTDEEKAMECLVDQNYDGIILDAASLNDVAALIKRVRSEVSNSTRVLVATTFPTWTRAREFFRAGANDYIYKSFNEQDIVLSLRTALNRP